MPDGQPKMDASHSDQEGKSAVIVHAEPKIATESVRQVPVMQVSTRGRTSVMSRRVRSLRFTSLHVEVLVCFRLTRVSCPVSGLIVSVFFR